MWKKIFLVLVILILAAVAGATVYVNNIDWNRHKDKISQEISAATGKDIVFGGSVRFNLFPSPYLEADNINVYNGYNEQGERVQLANIKKLVATLSIQSLLKGNFNVERMNLVEPEAFLELYDDGRLNWQSPNGGAAEELRFDGVEVSLDSVTVENAKLRLVSHSNEIDTLLSDLNAEVIAQSLYGPYRIEGSYIKDKIPGGFAISLGSFSDSFATSVNAVISHPQSESYVRFDGTVLLKNDAVNGNLIIESQNPVNFANSSFTGLNISEKYERPLMLSMEIKTDKAQINLANIAMKYGQSAGAGNILIPRQKEQIGEDGTARRRIDAVFNMTDMELQPLLDMLSDARDKVAADKKYIPEYDFDVIADLRAVKTLYRNQEIRDFSLSVDFMDNVFKVHNLSAILPGDTDFKSQGEIFSHDRQLAYNFDAKANINDFARLVTWLGWQPQVKTPGTFKRAYLNANVSGNLNLLKVSPLEFSLDKTNVSGRLGLVRGSTWRWLGIINIDNLNLDNYLSSLPEKLQNATLEEKINYQFSQLEALNQLDLQLRGSLKVGILGKIPFENMQADLSLKNGTLHLNNLSVDELANASFAISGDISGFGKIPTLTNLNYHLDIKDNLSFFDKFALNLPAVNLKTLTALTANGVITGSWNRFATKSNSKLGNIDIVYNGEVNRNNGVYYLSGHTEIKAPDFVRMLNQFSVNYAPNYPLGLFKFAGDIKGNLSTFSAQNINANIGSNQFAGSLVYQNKNNRHRLQADLKANRFELEKFFYSKAADSQSNFRNQETAPTFLPQPKLSLAKIDYSWFNDWDMDGKFAVDELSFNNISLQQASWLMGLRNNVVRVARFAAAKGSGTVAFDGELNVAQNARLTANFEVSNLPIKRGVLSGTVYGVTTGAFSGKAELTTSANTRESLLNELSGNARFTIAKPVFKGWDLFAIEQDLDKREVSDGFTELASQYLSQGNTEFRDFNGRVIFTNGAYSLDNAAFNADNFNVTVRSDGSLKDWNGDSSFRIVFTDVPHANGFDFSFEGSLAAPTMSADVSRVTKVYDDHWQEIAEKAKAEAEAVTKKYRGLMDEQQNTARETFDRLSGNIASRFATQSALAQQDGIKKEYAALNDKIQRSRQGLEQIFAQNELVNIDDEAIASLQKQNADLQQEVSIINKELADLHARDVRLRLEDTFNRVAELNRLAKQKVVDYQDAYGEFAKRLAEINSDFALTDNETVENLKNRIDENAALIDGTNANLAKDNLDLEKITDVEELETYFRHFDRAQKDAEDSMSKIEQNLAEFNRYAEDNIAAAEKTYAEKLKAIAIRKKLEENTGQISTGDGKTVTIGRELSEIEKSENAVKNDDVRVLDFSQNKVSGSLTSSQQKRKPTAAKAAGSGILRQNSGAVTQSGTIVVKP